MPGLLKRDFFTKRQKKRLITAIQQAERDTTGEIRIYIEHRCPYADPLQRAREIFQAHEMYRTAHRNAVLIYVATQDRKYALFGDEGIHQQVGDQFWQQAAEAMLHHFKRSDLVKGLETSIQEIGMVLKKYFPSRGSNPNELSDEILEGQ